MYLRRYRPKLNWRAVTQMLPLQLAPEETVLAANADHNPDQATTDNSPSQPFYRATQLLVASAVGTAVTTTYHYQIKLFWHEIHDNWRAHERMLAEDMRDAPPRPEADALVTIR